MGKHYPLLPSHLRAFITSQELFWVATAPMSGGSAGHVNVSPKGLRGSFHLGEDKLLRDITSEQEEGAGESEKTWIDEVWYDDLTGSGCETIAHLKEENNGRITVMFCAFEGAPNIVRIYGIGTVHEFGTPEYNQYIPPADRKPGSRAVIVIKINKVGTSCGYAIPFYTFAGHRRRLLSFASNLESKGILPPSSPLEEQADSTNRYASLRNYWRIVNMHSIDGIPALSAETYQAQRELKGMNVEEMARDGVEGRWGLVREDVEKAGGPGVASGKRRRAEGILGNEAGLVKRLIGGTKEDETRIFAGFVMGFVACGILQSVMARAR